MSLLEAFWLGIVQGLTEFLPVSSSGHLALFQQLLGGVPGEDLLFEVGVHVATLLAILWFYRRRIASLCTGCLGGDPAAWRYVGLLALATVPAAALGLLARGPIEASFDNPAVIGVGLVLTGTALFTTRFSIRTARALEPGVWVALLIGCAQALAIFPGISRSGATVAAALALGVAPLAAAEFSFLLGVVAITGAALLSLPDFAAQPAASWTAFSVGFAAALVAGLVALVAFVRILERRSFYVFAYYDWALGAAVIAWLALA